MWNTTLEPTGDACVVALDGDLDLHVVERLRETLATATAGSRHVVLDLSRVPFVDSTGLGALVKAHNTAKQKEGVLYLAGANRVVRSVLHVTGLESRFPTFPDVPTAINYLPGGSGGRA